MNIQRLAALLLLALPCLSYADDCQLTLSQPVVDYHQMRRDSIVTSQQSWNKMPEKDINVSVYCPEKQQMATLLQGASGQKGRFQFGQNGGVAIKVSNLTLDGKSYNVGKTTDQVILRRILITGHRSISAITRLSWRLKTAGYPAASR